MKSVATLLFPNVRSLDVFAEANRFVPDDDGSRIITIGTAPYPIIARTACHSASLMTSTGVTAGIP